MELEHPPLKGNRALCTECGRTFFSTIAFDLHRVGKFARLGEFARPADDPERRRCGTDAELNAKGVFQEGGVWCRGKRALPSLSQLAAARARRSSEISGTLKTGPSIRAPEVDEEDSDAAALFCLGVGT